MLDNGFLNVIKLEQAGGDNAPTVPAKDSNAARQRRYRQRKRNAVTGERNAVTRNVDTVTAVTQRDVDRNADVRSAIERDGETTMLPAQAQITLAFTDDGDLVLRQPDMLGGDDSVIVIAYENIPTFLDRLCDAAGVVGYKP